MFKKINYFKHNKNILICSFMVNSALIKPLATAFHIECVVYDCCIRTKERFMLYGILMCCVLLKIGHSVRLTVVLFKN
jgi:hypothetical protein